MGYSSDYSAKLHDRLVHRRCWTVEGPRTLGFDWVPGTYSRDDPDSEYYRTAWAEIANSGRYGGTMTSVSDLRAYSLQCLVAREKVFNKDVVHVRHLQLSAHYRSAVYPLPVRLAASELRRTPESVVR